MLSCNYADAIHFLATFQNPSVPMYVDSSLRVIYKKNSVQLNLRRSKGKKSAVGYLALKAGLWKLGKESGVQCVQFV